MKFLNNKTTLCLTALLCSNALFGMQRLPATQPVESSTPPRRTTSFVTHAAAQAQTRQLTINSVDLWQERLPDFYCTNSPAQSPLNSAQRAAQYAAIRASRYNSTPSSWLNSPVMVVRPAYVPVLITPSENNSPYAVARATRVQPTPQSPQLANLLGQQIANPAGGVQWVQRTNRYTAVQSTPEQTTPQSHPIFAFASTPIQTQRTPTIRRILFQPTTLDPRALAAIADTSAEENAFWDQSISAMEQQLGILNISDK